MSEPLKVGLVSASDRAAGGVYRDEGIPALKAWLAEVIVSPALHFEDRLIPDDRNTIEKTLKELVDEKGCHLVLTTGGTGPAPRYAWLNRTICVATGARRPASVELEFYEVK